MGEKFQGDREARNKKNNRDRESKSQPTGIWGGAEGVSVASIKLCGKSCAYNGVVCRTFLEVRSQIKKTLEHLPEHEGRLVVKSVHVNLQTEEGERGELSGENRTNGSGSEAPKFPCAGGTASLSSTAVAGAMHQQPAQPRISPQTHGGIFTRLA